MDALKPARATNIKTSTKIAALFFVFLILDTILFLSSAIYVGATSGELRSKILDPLKKKTVELSVAVEKAMEEKPTPTPYPYYTNKTDSNTTIKTESNVRININNRTSTYSGQKGYSQTEIRWVYPTYQPGQSYEELKKAQDEWWAQVQKQNQELSNQSKVSLEQFKQQSQQNLDNFKLQGQQGMEEFRQKALEDQQKFLQEHRITP